MKRYGFPKSRRLKSRKRLETLFGSGKRCGAKRVRLVYLTDPEETGVKFGVGVSARNFKRAVDRNQIKRRLREACRLQQGPLNDWARTHQKGLSVFMLYTGKQLPGYEELFEDTGLVFQKLLVAVNASVAEDT